MSDPSARRSALLGWGGSLAVHGAIVLLATYALAPPETGFEFQAPEEIELGLVEATEIAEPAPVPEAASEVEAVPESATASETSEPSETGSARPDAGPPRDAQPRRRRDAQPDAGPLVAGLGSGPPVAFLPAGAQLALRIDMDRIRTSPVGEDVRGLLRVIPDWQALLGGSDVDPVRDLSRVLIATPNLNRASVVVAGRLSPDAPGPRAIAEQLAAAEGVPVEWTEENGVARTRWPSPDATERDVALIGDRHFVIARGQDLPRVLAIAAARRGRRPASASAADALLSMEDGEGLSVEIENVAAFVRRAPIALPDRLRLGMIEHEDGVRIQAVASFAREEDVAPAQRYLDDLVERAAANVLVALYGLSGPLDRLDLTAEDRTLRGETELRYSEMRTIFGLLRGFLDQPARPAPPPAPPPLEPPPLEPPPSPFE